MSEPHAKLSLPQVGALFGLLNWLVQNYAAQLPAIEAALATMFSSSASLSERADALISLVTIFKTGPAATRFSRDLSAKCAPDQAAIDALYEHPQVKANGQIINAINNLLSNPAVLQILTTILSVITHVPVPA